jgi:type IV secretory pathway TrbL component
MNPLSKIAVPIAMAGIVLLPNLWLVSDPLLLMLFWLLALPTLMVFPIYYCRRCRHVECPLNKAVAPE